MRMTEMQYADAYDRLRDEVGNLEDEIAECREMYGNLDDYCDGLVGLIEDMWPWARAMMPTSQIDDFKSRMRELHVEVE